MPRGPVFRLLVICTSSDESFEVQTPLHDQDFAVAADWTTPELEQRRKKLEVVTIVLCAACGVTIVPGVLCTVYRTKNAAPTPTKAANYVLVLRRCRVLEGNGGCLPGTWC